MMNSNTYYFTRALSVLFVDQPLYDEVPLPVNKTTEVSKWLDGRKPMNYKLSTSFRTMSTQTEFWDVSKLYWVAYLW